MRAFIFDSCRIAHETDGHLLKCVDSSTEIETASEREHVASLTLRPADIDFVMCVIRSDGSEDYALIEMLGHWALGIPLAVLSKNDSLDEMLKARRCGAAGFIPLALRREIIINSIRVLLAGGTYFPTCRYLRDLDQASGYLRIGRAGKGTTSPTLTMLTPRQSEILDLMSQGLTNKEIARKIGLSDGTIRAHVAAIFRALGVRNRLQATRIYFEGLQARA